MNTENSVLFHNTKVYSLLQFEGSRREKGREYKSWVNRVNWVKRNNMLMRRKRELSQTLNFLSVFSFSSHVFVHGPASSARPLFGAHPKIGARNLSSVITSPRLVLNCLSLPPHDFSPTSSYRFVPLHPSGRIISVSSGSVPAQKIWDLRFFSAFLINVVTYL